MKLKKYFIFVLTIFFTLNLCIANASEKEEDPWISLDSISDQALQLTKNQEYDRAIHVLNLFLREFEVVKNNNDSTISLSEGKIINNCYNEAIDALSNNDNHEEVMQKLLQFRLLIDAMHSEYQPMWYEMESIIFEAFSNMKESLFNANVEKHPSDVDHFLRVVEMIYPSLVIDLDKYSIEKIQNHLTFLEDYRSTTVEKQKEHLSYLERDLEELFQQKSSSAISNQLDEKDPTFLWLLISIAGTIVLSLSYVGWRKYQADHV